MTHIFIKSKGYINMKEISIIFVLAILIEALVDALTEALSKEGLNKKKAMTLAVGVVMAIVFNGDLTAYLGLHTDIPFVGCIVTGIILSRGSNYLHDFVKKITEIKK